MKQIFLKVYPNGKTSTNATVLNFDRENKSGEIVIDFSLVDYLDWIKQLDLVFADGTHTFITGSGNTLTVPLLESYLKKGSMTVQPVAKNLVGAEYDKVKWQVVALSVRDSLNVLEDDTSITPSVSEQWEIRIDLVEQAELIRISNEDTRISQESSRVSAEDIRISSENTRIDNEDDRIVQENARLVFVAYDGLTSYIVGNKVSYLGSSYVCILNSLGNLPTNSTYWLLIASKGEQGIQGANTTATNVTNTPSGNISSTTVQGAINELDTEKAPTVHTHDDRYYTETEVNTLLNAKANITQEAWITPTLLNSWTGTVKYRKNQFGDVVFKGTLTGGLTTTTAFIMPVGYRPLEAIIWTSNSNYNTLSTGYVSSSSGAFVPNNAGVTSISMGGIFYPTT